MLKKLNDNRLFEELYCLILTVISLICWRFNGNAGVIVILVIAILSLILFNDFKYIIPCLLCFLFSNSSGFETTSFPIAIIVCGFGFLFVLLYYMIRNGLHIFKAKSLVGIALLGISCILPFFWNNVIGDGQEVLYFMYLAYFLYFVIYILFASCLNKNSFKMLVPAMGYMAILLAMECGLKVFELHRANPEENILNFWYYLGWGLCNEAGIMMCVGVPFIFIQLLKSDKWYKSLVSLIKIAIVIIGMLLTTSRGTFLFGYIEIFVLFIYTLIVSKKRVLIGSILIGGVVLTLTMIQIKIGIPNLLSNIKDIIFGNGFDTNGRMDLWTKGINMWLKDPISTILGSGIVSEFEIRESHLGIAEVYLVYHSTILETLAAFGIVGLIFLFIHLFEKYKQVFKFDKGIAGIMLIGYIMVDIYGLIDNTYIMYYYMIPLVIIMASIDNIRLENNA